LKVGKPLPVEGINHGLAMRASSAFVTLLLLGVTESYSFRFLVNTHFKSRSRALNSYNSPFSPSFVDDNGNENTAEEKKIALSWCAGGVQDDECRIGQLREQVENSNEIAFRSPATGQVVYNYLDNFDRQDLPAVKRTILLLLKKDSPSIINFVSSKTTPSDSTPDFVNISIIETLVRRGVNICFERDAWGDVFGSKEEEVSAEVKARTRIYDPEDGENIDLVVTLGGDGLLMHANSLFPHAVPPVLSLAGGSLGFLTPFRKDDIVEDVMRSLGMDINNDRIPLSLRMRLTAEIFCSETKTKQVFTALNDITIDRGSSPSLTNIETYVDNTYLTNVQADGVIFATPTGSTAYSMAAGGSVVHPAVPCILFTPICPHVLSFRSMVFPDHSTLRCLIPKDSRSGAVVSFDGKNSVDLRRGDEIVIRSSRYPFPSVNKVDHSKDWIKSLKRSFGFNERIIQKGGGSDYE